jgi:hypothetical protein
MDDGSVNGACEHPLMPKLTRTVRTVTTKRRFTTPLSDIGLPTLDDRTCQSIRTCQVSSGR